MQDRAGRGVAAFRWVVRRFVLVGLLLALAVSSGVSANQATPEASPTAIDPGPCTTEPLSNDQMRELIEAGLPPIVAIIAGTPIAGATPVLQSTEGDLADEATVAAVMEAVLQLVACTNAGNLPAVAAMLTEQGAASILSLGYLQFHDMFAGATGTPTAEIDPELLNTYLATMQMHGPLPADFQITLYGIETVTELENGWVRAIVLLATGEKEPRKTSILLREEDGRYRINCGRDTGIGAPSMPAP